MKLQSLTIIFIIIILPIVLVLSAYIGYEIKTINKQNMYNTGLNTATHDAIFAFEMNTKNDSYSNNAENKRSNIKASIKAFENSLSTACNLGLYNNEAIEEYIPAIVFGLYDGFYMYAPSESQNREYKHDLRNYVYYSEEIKENNIDIIIRYTLDNYIAVSGTVNGEYITRAGYLINLNDLNSNIKDINMNEVTTIKYKNIDIGIETVEEYNGPYDEEGTNRQSSHEDKTAIAYYKSAYEFTDWFMNETGIGTTKEYLNIGNDNDPENENSYFVQHKRQIMKQKIEEVLNSSITAYANKTRTNYKMPKFTEEDWEKIYNNISVISLVQGMNLGFKSYNNYCILNSTNNNEYVNPNLIYFTDGNSYHDIRCTDESIDWENATGYKIGSFEKQTYETEKVDEDGNSVTDAEGNPVIENKYYYKHNELACYDCINGNAINEGSIYDYVRADSTDSNVKISYFSALARERYTTIKLLNSYNAEYIQQCTITYETEDSNNVTEMPEPQTVNIGEPTNISDKIPQRSGYSFEGWTIEGETGTYNPGDQITCWGNETLVAKWKISIVTIKIYDVDNKELIKTIEYNTDKKSTYMNGKYKWVNGTIVYEYTTEKLIKVDDKAGYELQGIYDNVQCEGTDYNGKGYTYVTASTNLYAKYEKNIYTVSYHYSETYIDEITGLEYGDSITIRELPSSSEDGYCVAWKASSTDYSPGQEVQITTNINLYPKIVNPTMKLEYYTGSSWNVLNLNEEKYTNKDKIRVVSSIGPNQYIKFYINNIEQNENGTEYLTGENEIREININYKFEIFNIKGEKMDEKIGTKYIMVDRKPPVITNFRKNSKFGGTTGYIYVDVTDEGTGISAVRTNWLSLLTTDMTRDENGYTYWKWADAIHKYASGRITATDIAGNSTTYSY